MEWRLCIIARFSCLPIRSTLPHTSSHLLSLDKAIVSAWYLSPHVRRLGTSLSRTHWTISSGEGGDQKRGSLNSLASGAARMAKRHVSGCTATANQEWAPHAEISRTPLLLTSVRHPHTALNPSSCESPRHGSCIFFR